MIYNIGDRIVDNRRDLTIIDKRIFGEKCKTRTYFKYRCNICGYDCGKAYRYRKPINELWISNEQLSRGHGCSCCRGITVSPDINSVSKVKPELIKYFANREDADKHSISSNQKVYFKCPECNEYSNKMSIDHFIKQGFSCPRCSDKISIGEKIIYLLLSNLGIDFIKEFSFNDSVLRYDFYIPSLSTIIEVHGRQHYEGSFQTYRCGKTLEEEQSNDKEKYEFALQNGIERYIVIDARKSDYDYIRRSIISEFATILDLSKVNWDSLKREVFEKNIIKDVSIYWESHPTVTYDEMSSKFHFCRDTIRKYIKIGNSLGWCSSSTSMNNSHYNNLYKYDAPDTTKPIKCVDNNTYFKGSCLCSKVSDKVFGVTIGDSTLRHILNGLKSKSRKIKYSFEYVTKEEFNKAITDGLQCYGSPYSI